MNETNNNTNMKNNTNNIMPINEITTAQFIQQYYMGEGINNVRVIADTKKSTDDPSEISVGLAVEGTVNHAGVDITYYKHLYVDDLKIIIGTVLEKNNFKVNKVDVKLTLDPSVKDSHGLVPLDIGGRLNGITVDCEKKLNPETVLDSGRTM